MKLAINNLCEIERASTKQSSMSVSISYRNETNIAVTTIDSMGLTAIHPVIGFGNHCGDFIINININYEAGTEAKIIHLDLSDAEGVDFDTLQSLLSTYNKRKANINLECIVTRHELIINNAIWLKLFNITVIGDKNKVYIDESDFRDILVSKRNIMYPPVVNADPVVDVDLDTQCFNLMIFEDDTPGAKPHIDTRYVEFGAEMDVIIMPKDKSASSATVIRKRFEDDAEYTSVDSRVTKYLEYENELDKRVELLKNVKLENEQAVASLKLTNYDVSEKLRDKSSAVGALHKQMINNYLEQVLTNLKIDAAKAKNAALFGKATVDGLSVAESILKKAFL